MKKTFITIILVLFGTGVFAQSGMGDFINMKYGNYGLEYVKDTQWHQNGTIGYFNVLPLTDAVIDTIYFIGSSRPVSGSFIADTLRKGIEVPLKVKSIKLKKGKVLLFKNKTP